MNLQKLYSICMSLGKCTGCHQRADRSFLIHGKQFPVCARCSGVFLGQLISLFTFRFYRLPLTTLISFCFIMLLDWLIQFWGIRESRNWRRLLTGTLCGYGFGSILLQALYLAKHIFTL